MTPTELRKAKDTFLRRYNPSRREEIALTSGLRAAAQHNPLYKRGLSPSDRQRIRRGWKTLLQQTAAKYQRQQDSKVYERDVEEFARAMNDRFAECFREPGFRVSHAQKSLAVFLKHLWCMDEIETPPQCPVDRVILRSAGLRGNDIVWTRVNSIEDHRRRVDYLMACAERDGLGLAEWELAKFSA